MLRAQNLVVKGRLNVPDLVAEAGTLTVVLGSNGAGKSTLLAALAGLHEVDDLVLCDQDLDLLSLSAQERAKRLALLTQRQTLEFDFSVEEVVRMGLHPLSLSSHEAQLRFEHIVERLDLGALLQRRYTTLSRGEAQRTQIARVLMQRCEQRGLVLMDEPLTALDLRHQQDVMLLISELKQKEGHAFILVLHDLNLAAQYGDQFVLLEQGSLAGVGGSEMLQPELLSRVFEIPIERQLDSQGRLQFITGTIKP